MMSTPKLRSRTLVSLTRAATAFSEKPFVDDDRVTRLDGLLQIAAYGRFFAIDHANDLHPTGGTPVSDATGQRNGLPHGHSGPNRIFTGHADLTRHEHRLGARNKDRVARPEHDVLRQRAALQLLQVDADRVTTGGAFSGNWRGGSGHTARGTDNHRLWSRMFRDRSCAGEGLYQGHRSGERQRAGLLDFTHDENLLTAILVHRDGDLRVLQKSPGEPLADLVLYGANAQATSGHSAEQRIGKGSIRFDDEFPRQLRLVVDGNGEYIVRPDDVQPLIAIDRRSSSLQHR